MSITAEICPNCGAPLTVVNHRCVYCDATIATAPLVPGGPQPASVPQGDPHAPFAMTVEDVFEIPKKGTIATGKIEAGTIKVGDRLLVDHGGKSNKAECIGIEMFRKQMDTAAAGDNVGLVLKGVDKKSIAPGDKLRRA
jgi:translation elongation factor EF-Tu-like GTPase